MRKAFRHSGVLMMAAVVALGLLGAAYTLWYEDLQIRAEVSTGTFDADVSVHAWDGTTSGPALTSAGLHEDVGHPVVIQCSQPITGTNSALWVFGHLANWGCTYGSFPANKLDAATVCDAVIGTFGTVPANANDATDNNQLTLLIGGAFPYAGCEYDIDFHNGGSVPFHLNFDPASLLEYWLCDPDGADVGTEPDNCVLIPQTAQAISWIWGPDCGWDGADANGMLTDGGSPVQVHSGDEVRCKVKVLLDQGANLENKVVVSNLRFRAYQWNETVDTTP